MGSLGIVPNLGQIYNPDSFTGDGSNTTFTLTHLVTSDQSVIWVEGGVVQKPGIDFTIAGLTLTRTTAPANLVACFAMYLGVSLDIGVPSDGTVTLAKMAVNSVDSDQYVDGSIDAVHLSANSVDSDAYVDGSIDAIHLSANSVDSDAYVDASIDLAHMSSESVDEDNLHISNSGSNGEFLSKQSGDAGGLTWAAPAGGADTDLSNVSATGENKVAQAWVIFSGAGSLAVLDSGGHTGVSSVTDNGTGDYTITMASALGGNRYAIGLSVSAATASSGQRAVVVDEGTYPTTTVFTVQVSYVTSETDRTAIDEDLISAIVFGD